MAGSGFSLFQIWFLLVVWRCVSFGDGLSPCSGIVCLSEVSLRWRVESSSSCLSSAWRLAVEARLSSAQDRRQVSLCVILSGRARMGCCCVVATYSVRLRVPLKVWLLSSVVHGCSFFYSVNCSIFVCPSHFAVLQCSASSRFRASSFRFMGCLDSPSTASPSRRKRVKSRFSATVQGARLKF